MTSVDDWFLGLVAGSGDRAAATADALQSLDNAGVLAKVVVHRYVCPRCGPVAVVVKIGGRTLARTRDYTQSRGRNAATTDPAARRMRTLDGERHWPGHVFDLDRMAGWGDALSVPIRCRHHDISLSPADILAVVAEVKPGHPGPPTLL